MVRIDKKTGNIIVEIENDKSYTPAEELQMRRDALYDALTEHDSDQFIGNSNMVYGIVLLLKDMDPTFEQWNEILT